MHANMEESECNIRLSHGLFLQLARAKLEAPRFIAGALRDEAVGGLPGFQRRDIRGEVLPAKGPARAPWPKLRLQVGHLPTPDLTEEVVCYHRLQLLCHREGC